MEILPLPEDVVAGNLCIDYVERAAYSTFLPCVCKLGIISNPERIHRLCSYPKPAEVSTKAQCVHVCCVLDHAKFNEVSERHSVDAATRKAPSKRHVSAATIRRRPSYANQKIQSDMFVPLTGDTAAPSAPCSPA